jgi:NhaP-type Na+/H+ or K+/H+ antiporter
LPSEPLVLAGFGAAILGVAWLPLVLRPLPVSLPMLAVALGTALSVALGGANFPSAHREAAERLTEFGLIVAVMGAGLKIDRPFAWRRWGSVWRLLGVAMPLSILGVTFLGHLLLGLPAAMAVLLGGILAPTDPVLASAVEVGPPGSGEADEVRFALTAEAGLNDGLAFPFVSLGLLMLARGPDPRVWLGDWVLVHLLWKTASAVVIGFLLGWGLVRLNRRLPEHFRLTQSGDGLAAIGVTFLAYGLTQAVDGYGFVAVFVTAVALRNVGRSVDYARTLAGSAAQAERLAIVLVLAFFGAALAGGLLAPLTWAEAGFTALVLLVVRPVATLLGFLGSARPAAERLAMGYFGVRGLGSLFYAAYAANQQGLERPPELWAVVGLAVLASVVLYGVSTDAVMRLLDRRSG